MEFIGIKSVEEFKAELKKNECLDIKVDSVNGFSNKYHMYIIKVDVRVIGQDDLYRLQWSFPIGNGKILIDKTHEAYYIIKKYFDVKKRFNIKYSFYLSESELLKTIININGNMNGLASIELFKDKFLIK